MHKSELNHLLILFRKKGELKKSDSKKSNLNSDNYIRWQIRL